MQNGYITRMVEKPQEPLSHDAVVGLYYFKKAGMIYDAIHEQVERGIMLKNEYFLADAIGVMVAHGAKLKVLPVTEWEDTGTRDAILHANRYLLRKAQGDAPATPYAQGSGLVVPPVHLGAEAQIAGSVIGPYVSVGAGLSHHQLGGARQHHRRQDAGARRCAHRQHPGRPRGGPGRLSSR